MSVINAKCPNCGSPIMLDDRCEGGLCPSCGSRFKNSDAISQMRVAESGYIANYLELARMACETFNTDEVAHYVRKALEINPKNADAWELKMYTLSNKEEIIAIGKRAMKYDTSAERKRSVYRMYLSLCVFFMESSVENLMMDTDGLLGIDQDAVYSKTDVSTVMSFYDILNKQMDDFDVANCDSDSPFILYEDVADAIKLRFAVPDECISGDDELSAIVVNIARIFIDCQRLCFKWHNLDDNEMYDCDMSMGYWKRTLDRIKSGVSYIYVTEQISEKRFRPKADSCSGQKNDKPVPANDNPAETSQGREGCYIATAVYGSYDAPEVMALRGFRDNVLAKSCLGRTFIRIYYMISPPIAERLKDAKRINRCVRYILDRLIMWLRD